jgi:APA family basic amino acid/polyamine antiporter
MTEDKNAAPELEQPPGLERKIGLGSAVSLNMINMIGVGPFITLPLVVGAMGGFLGGWGALAGWLLGALIAVCDGLVWAELGAAMPEAGGSYAYLREIYGREGAGRLVSFLYIWQLGFSAPLSVASGCIGFAQFAAFLFPGLHEAVRSGWPLRWTSLLAAAVCLLIVALLYRNLQQIARMAWVLWGGVMFTMGMVLLAGFTHFHTDLFRLSAQAWTVPSAGWAALLPGLGAATLIATYDYWGYYNVCLLGGEVREPGKTIPRAVLISIFAVALLYVAMNISVLGGLATSHLSSTAVADMVSRTLGAKAGVAIAALIMWAAFSSVFALLTGYSRVPYAAAVDGNYFRAFAHVHPKHRFPDVSLLALGGVAAVFCFFDLSQVIAALVVIRIVLQYVLQQVGVVLLRIQRPEMRRPFRIWLYPLPPLAALAGFLFILLSRHEAQREFLYAMAVAVAGSLVFFLRAQGGGEWPFRSS